MAKAFLDLEKEGIVEFNLSLESGIELWVIEAVVDKTIFCLIVIEDIFGLMSNCWKSMWLPNRTIEHHLLEACIQPMQ